MKDSGVYLFAASSFADMTLPANSILYVGMSKSLSQRLASHAINHFLEYWGADFSIQKRSFPVEDCRSQESLLIGKYSPPLNKVKYSAIKLWVDLNRGLQQTASLNLSAFHQSELGNRYAEIFDTAYKEVGQCRN